jgi:hypothetical protein
MKKPFSLIFTHVIYAIDNVSTIRTVSAMVPRITLEVLSCRPCPETPDCSHPQKFISVTSVTILDPFQ